MSDSNPNLREPARNRNFPDVFQMLLTHLQAYHTASSTEVHRWSAECTTTLDLKFWSGNASQRPLANPEIELRQVHASELRQVYADKSGWAPN
ncbi:hypothetical protein NMY22_g12960 [Coprinellus aureogranulatus]|nr:hypothetical protein NMY22_g12960 [Coprinellus aureogranulatus]